MKKYNEMVSSDDSFNNEDLSFENEEEDDKGIELIIQPK